MKYFLIALVALLVGIWGGMNIPSASVSPEDEVSELEVLEVTTDGELRDDESSLEEQIASLQSQVLSLQNQVNTKDSELSALKDLLERMAADVEANEMAHQTVPEEEMIDEEFGIAKKYLDLVSEYDSMWQKTIARQIKNENKSLMALHNEVVDPVWAGDTEMQLKDSFLLNYDPDGFNVLDVSCKTSVCQVLIDSSIDGSEFVKLSQQANRRLEESGVPARAINTTTTNWRDSDGNHTQIIQYYKRHEAE